MNEKRKDQIFNNLIDWVCQMGRDYVQAAFCDLSNEEIKELDLQDWFD